MNTKKTLAVVVGLSAGAAVALAGTFAMADGRKDHHRGFSFEKIDTNADGFLTVAEIEQAHAVRFSEKDANNDGFLTKDEIKAHMQAKAAERGKDVKAERMDKRLDRMFERVDANDDGKISLEEMPHRGAAKIMERLDKDNDGRISKAEAEAFKGKRKHRG